MFTLDEFAKIVNLMAQVLLGSASVFVATLAYRVWRAQLILGKRYELARRALSLVFGVRESVLVVRDSPVDIITGRLIDILDFQRPRVAPEKRPSVSMVTREVARERLAAHEQIYDERWVAAWETGSTEHGFQQRLSELAVVRSEVEAVLGPEQARKVEVLEGCLRKLGSAYGDYFHFAPLLLSAIGSEELNKEIKTAERSHGYELDFSREKARERVKDAADVLQSRDSDDAFGDEVELAVQELRSSFGTVLELRW